MAKLTGPLLSFGAKGQIGKSMVVAKWRGIDYARSYVKPANPQTTAQMANRTRFALLREMWKLAPSIVTLPWVAFTQGRPFLPVNKWVGENNRMLAGETDMANLIMSPGAKGGLPPLSVAAVTGDAAGEIKVTVTPSASLPVDWTVKRVFAGAVPDQDPTGLFSGPFVAGEQANPATAIVLGGFAPGADVIACGWIEYEKPNGELAYSVSIMDAATAHT